MEVDQLFIASDLDAEENLITADAAHPGNQVRVADQVARPAHEEPLNIELSPLDLVEKVDHLLALRVEVVIHEIKGLDSVMFAEKLHLVRHQLPASRPVHEEIPAPAKIDQPPFVAKAARPFAAAASHRLVVALDSGKADVLVHREEVVRRHGQLVQVREQRTRRSELDVGIVPKCESQDLLQLRFFPLQLFKQLDQSRLRFTHENVVELGSKEEQILGHRRERQPSGYGNQLGKCLSKNIQRFEVAHHSSRSSFRHHPRANKDRIRSDLCDVINHFRLAKSERAAVEHGNLGALLFAHKRRQMRVKRAARDVARAPARPVAHGRSQKKKLHVSPRQ